MSKSTPMLILIAGGTCSGKSTLAKKLGDFFSTVFLSSDDFVNLKIKGKTTDVEIISEGRGMDEKQIEEFNENAELRTEMERRWNDPKNVDWKKLVNKVKKIIKSNSETQKIIFVEGLHALQNEELRKMADVKIFSDTAEDLRLILKCQRSPWYKEMVGEKPRDPRNFGGIINPLPHALEAWQKGVRPGEIQWVIPTKHYADLILNYNETADFPKNVELLSVMIDLYFEKPEEFQKKIRKIREQRWKEGSFAEEPLSKAEIKKMLSQPKKFSYWPWILVVGTLAISLIICLVWWKKKNLKKRY